MARRSFRNRQTRFEQTMLSLDPNYYFKNKHFSTYLERINYGDTHETVCAELTEHIKRYGDEFI